MSVPIRPVAAHALCLLAVIGCASPGSPTRPPTSADVGSGEPPDRTRADAEGSLDGLSGPGPDTDADGPSRPGPDTAAPGPGDPSATPDTGVDRPGSDEPIVSSAGGAIPSRGALAGRAREERRAGADNPYVIVAHRPNYFLPISYTTALNEAVYRENDVRLREGLEPTEVKFQISLKTRLNERDLLVAGDALALAITIEAWWQLYSEDISSPFRETNYAPEMFYLTPLPWHPFDGRTAVVLGLEHQSNGQVQGLSRSWNRLYATLLYERGDFVASIRPWYRLPEGEKETPDDAEGDDNPDILDFTGHGEVAFAWRDDELEYALRGRGNPATGKGAVTLEVTFPLFGRFRALVQYFNGYGDSLVDYDHFQSRLGLGVALTNLF